MDSVLHSSAKHDYQTPERILALAREVMTTIKCDPATDHSNPAGAKVYFTRDDDGLGQKWPSPVWCNPPYGAELRKLWAPRIVQHEGEAMVLVPSRTDTAWFRALWSWSNALCFVSGRITFRGEKHPAPFPSVIFYRGPLTKKFYLVFQQIGVVV